VARRDPYVVLGVSAGATQAQVKSAWRRLAREHHPDLAASPAEQRAATRRMAEINAAYADLTGVPGRRRGPGPAAGGGRPGQGGPPFQRPSGPPPPPPTRPVTARLDTTELLHHRNATTSQPASAARRRRAPDQPPPRARGQAPEAPRASQPTGPAERRLSNRRRTRRPPALEMALAVPLTFGKFHGHTLGEVAAFEPSYVDWIARTITRDPDLVAAARVVVAELDRTGVERRTRERGRRPGAPAMSGDEGATR
jgi:molecular chaperone DnaJ